METINLPVWHVCSLEETDLFYGEPKKFAIMVSEAQAQLGVRRSGTADDLNETLVLRRGPSQIHFMHWRDGLCTYNFPTAYSYQLS